MPLIRVAIVEDEADCRAQTVEYLQRYREHNNVSIQLREYADGLDLTEDFRGQFDIVFCDIQMKHMNGMKAAEYIRERDDKVIIIFITNLAEYAIMGYDLMAAGYLLKPINYNLFSRYMDRAVRMLSAESPKYLIIQEKKGMRRFPLDEICYLECDGHYINIHLKNAEMPRIYMSIKELEPLLPQESFARCSSGILVNLNYVDAMEGSEIVVNGERLAVSRSQRKPFAAKLAEHLSGL